MGPMRKKPPMVHTQSAAANPMDRGPNPAAFPLAIGSNVAQLSSATWPSDNVESAVGV